MSANITDARDAMLKGKVDAEAFFARFITEFYLPEVLLGIQLELAAMPENVRNLMTPEQLQEANDLLERRL